MTRLISFISAKGGVGKTTLVANLAAALADLGEKIIAMDANLTTPNLALHLGMHLSPNTLHHVIRGESSLEESIYPHRYGFKVIPASLNLNDLRGVDPARLSAVSFSLLGKASYILMDCAAGIGREALSGMAASDEVVIVTNPNFPAVTDALKILKIAQSSDMKILGVILNRVTRSAHEISPDEIRDVLGIPILAVIPEDENVMKSIQSKKLLFEYNSNSTAAIEIKRLAAYMSGREFIPMEENSSAWEKFVRWLTT